MLEMQADADDTRPPSLPLAFAYLIISYLKQKKNRSMSYGSQIIQDKK